jgi:small-conductance mechanosensitive channel
VGFVLLAAVALGSVPLLASALVGVVVIFGRRIRLHERIGIGEIEGVVAGLDLLEVRLVTDSGETRVPMLSLMRLPTRRLGSSARASARISVHAGTDVEVAEAALRDAAATLMRNVEVHLESASLGGLAFRVSGDCDSAASRVRLLTTLVGALARSGIGLGGSKELLS